MMMRKLHTLTDTHTHWHTVLCFSMFELWDFSILKLKSFKNQLQFQSFVAYINDYFYDEWSLVPYFAFINDLYNKLSYYFCKYSRKILKIFYYIPFWLFHKFSTFIMQYAIFFAFVNNLQSSSGFFDLFLYKSFLEITTIISYKLRYWNLIQNC